MRRVFIAWLSLITVAGVGFRILYVVVTRHLPIGLDSTWYFLVGGFLQHGQGYSDPGSFFALSREIPTASWTPLYPGYLAASGFVTGSSIEAARLAGLLPAAFTILGTGLLAKKVFDDDVVALVSAAIVALSPMIVTTSMSLMSEVLSVPLTVALMLVAQSITSKPTVVRFLLYGALAGCAGLARPDVFVVALVLLGFLLFRFRLRRMVVLSAGLAVIVCFLAVVPWLVRNESVLHTFSLTTTSSATAIAGSNCGSTYSGKNLGFWDFSCIHNAQRTPFNEVTWSTHIERDGIAYAASHPQRLPAVVGARIARTWGWWNPRELASEATLETRAYGWQLVGWFIEVPLLLLAAIALFMLRRRWPAIFVLIAPLVAVTLTSAVTYGNQRFRSPAEPAIAILAAWTLCRLWRHDRQDSTTAVGPRCSSTRPLAESTS